MLKFTWSEELPLKFTKHGQPYDPGSIYIARSREEYERAGKLNLPCIIYEGTKAQFVSCIVYPFLCSKFPGINWNQQLDFEDAPRYYTVPVEGTDEENGEVLMDTGSGANSAVSDCATSTRRFGNQGYAGDKHEMLVDISKTWNCDYKVDVEKLIELSLLPAFIKDVTVAVESVLDDVRWQSGYNKKLRLCNGTWTDKTQADNLIIIDCSYSIPRGVSSTMLTLAETLCEKFKADILLTARHSQLWEYGDHLPNPQQLRNIVPLGQESFEFHRILNNQIAGKVYDNVICFGDYDQPAKLTREGDAMIFADPPKVGKVWSFRVGKSMKGRYFTNVAHHHSKKNHFAPVGYCQWVWELGIKPDYEEHEDDWCKFMED